MELRVNNTLWNIAVALGFFAMAITMVVVISKDSNTTVIVSNTGCCSITVTEAVTGDYIVEWEDNTSIEGFTFAEVTDKEGLDWTINEFQDFCYTHHFQ